LRLLTFSGYLNDEFSYRRWLLNAGIRFSRYDNTAKTQHALSPRLKANYFLNDKNKFMIAYDRMCQPINTINEMNYNV